MISRDYKFKSIDHFEDFLRTFDQEVTLSRLEDILQFPFAYITLYRKNTFNLIETAKVFFDVVEGYPFLFVYKDEEAYSDYESEIRVLSWYDKIKPSEYEYTEFVGGLKSFHGWKPTDVAKAFAEAENFSDLSEVADLYPVTCTRPFKSVQELDEFLLGVSNLSGLTDSRFKFPFGKRLIYLTPFPEDHKHFLEIYVLYDVIEGRKETYVARSHYLLASRLLYIAANSLEDIAFLHTKSNINFPSTKNLNFDKGVVSYLGWK